jgi:hypothetical protein
MCVPHNETNKSPTWSDYDGERFHRQGAAAYTFCENDDQEMLEARMAVTYRLTGSYDGQIDKREYYYAYLADFKEKLAIMNGTAGPKSTEDDNGEEETMPNSQEDNFASPDGMDDKEDINRTPQKKRKVSQPPSAAAAAAPIFAAPHEDSTESPVHVVMALPVTGTVVDVHAFFNQFQTGFGRGHVSLCRYAPFPEFPSALIECANSSVAENLCEFISTHALFGKYKCVTHILTEKHQFDALDTTIVTSQALEKLSEDPLLHYIKYNTPADADMDLYQMMLTTTIPQEVLTHFMTNLKQDEDLMECKANPIQVPETVVESTADMALEVEFEGTTDDYDDYTGTRVPLPMTVKPSISKANLPLPLHRLCAFSEGVSGTIQRMALFSFS